MRNSCIVIVALLLISSSVFCLASEDSYFYKYRDALLHALHGHVKKCITTNTKNDSETVLEFKSDGTEVLSDNIHREWRWGGVPVMDIDNQIHPFMSAEADTTFYSIQEDAIYTKGLSNTIDYLNSDGDVVRSESVVLFLGRITYSYNILKKDDHGNWLSREVRDEYGNLVCCEQRIVTYWDDDEMNAAEAFVELDRELSIDDILYKPFGVVDPVDGNPWKLHFSDVSEAVCKRSNWECQDYFNDGVIVYGNDIYGEKKPIGYNLTYCGEPVFSVSARSGLYDALQCYEISFERGVAGKVPSALKYDSNSILSRPQWTEQDAIAFADTLAADISSRGIKFSRIKSRDGHFYVMQGNDEMSNYKIDVYKHIDKYSAFLMVSLIVSPRESASNNF